MKWRTNDLKKICYIMAGMIALTIGAIGTVIPGLPTTPFLLLALFCFTRGSKRLNQWFIETKLYKNHLEEYIREKSLTRMQKLTILLFSGTMILTSCIIVDNLVFRIVLILAFCIQNFIFHVVIKTKK